MIDVIIGIIFTVGFVVLCHGAFLIVRDKERAWHIEHDKKLKDNRHE